jgi:hypothetical protein
VTTTAELTADEYAAWQERVRGKNISETSLLATDYLNHFNEIIMLIGMVPDMPEMIEDCKTWKPKSYADHFRDSGFSAKDVAIEAYEHSPAQFRVPFDQTTQRLNDLVAYGIDRIERLIKEGDELRMRQAAEESVRLLQKLNDFAASIINGTTLNQAEIDQVLGQN